MEGALPPAAQKGCGLITLTGNPTDPAAAGFLLGAGFSCDDIFRGCAQSHATENILMSGVHYLT